ncbi:murein transglycosylase [bacterium BRH_c32]|nr:MAG: murein transglycosylase [bacterium BRH_c32]
MKNKITLIVSLSLFVFTSIFLFLNASGGQKENSKGNELPREYKITMPPMPDKIIFAGEEIPIYDFEVKERAEREFLVNTYWHSAAILYLKRSGRWFPVIEPILKKYNVPDDFKYLCVAESGLTNAISPASAIGFWQFIEPTGKKFGLEINKEIDERYHIEKATEAACKYILSAYSKYNSWSAAAASYNVGFDGIEKQFSRQKSRNYFNLVFNEETSRYLFRIAAYKYLFEDPEKYGFFLDKEEYYKPIPTFDVKVVTSIESVADFAKTYGINYKIIKYFNPWIRDNFLNNKSGSEYIIKIPEPGSIKIIAE